MAVCLSRLPGLPVFDAVGEPATLAQCWMTWRAEFELYVTASGISDPIQKRALLLPPRVRDIFNNSIAADVRGGAKDYDKPWTAYRNTASLVRTLQWRDNFLAAKPSAGETINNFMTRLQKLAEHCDCEGEQDNQVRDRAFFHKR